MHLLVIVMRAIGDLVGFAFDDEQIALLHFVVEVGGAEADEAVKTDQIEGRCAAEHFGQLAVVAKDGDHFLVGHVAVVVGLAGHDLGIQIARGLARLVPHAFAHPIELRDKGTVLRPHKGKGVG